MSLQSSPLYHLDARPVLGVPLAGVSVLRLDLEGGCAPGNKWFKLQGNIALARTRGASTLVSFGGAWSNHLHALAATGRQLGLQTVGIVRGEKPAQLSAMLSDARRWGMELVFVSREEYRRKSDPEYLAQVEARFAPCLLIPEGGANQAGVAGCKVIGQRVAASGLEQPRVVLAVGTGTTLAGIAQGLDGSGAALVGISVLRGAYDLDARIEGMLGQCASPWRVLHDYHCGGYARVSPRLREFILAFEAVHGIPLDPVYTGKALFAVHQLIASGQWQAERPVVFVHTGGVQGRRGFSWLRAID